MRMSKQRDPHCILYCFSCNSNDQRIFLSQLGEEKMRKIEKKKESAPPIKMDEVNLSIIKHLRDGRTSLKKIARDLSITENTVRARLNKLLNEGVLEISGLVEPDAIPGHSVVMAGIKLNTMDLVRKGEEFSRLRGVVSVCVVTGRFDLIVTVLLNEQLTLLNFYTEEVSRIKDVASAETFVVYKGYNMKLPYIL